LEGNVTREPYIQLRKTFLLMVKATGEVELLWSGLINSVKQNGKLY